MRKIFCSLLFLAQILQLSTGFAMPLSAPSEIPQSISFFYEEVFNPNNSAHSVVLIRDQGKSASDRLVLADTVRAVLTEENIRNVFQEGAIGDASLAEIRWRFPSAALTSVGSEYLSQGGLTAAEYLTLTWKYDFRLMGSEDPILYVRTSEQYALARNNWSQLSLYFNKLQNTLARLEPEMRVDSHRRRLASITQNISDLRAFLSLQDSEKNYAALKHQFAERQMHSMYAFLKARISEMPELSQLPVVPFKDISTALDDAGRFYRTEAELDRGFLENALKDARRRKLKKFAVIAGGSRLAGFRDYLKDNGIAYSVAAAPSTPDMSLEEKFDKRPVRTRLGFELGRDAEPAVWRLMKDLGLTHRQAVELLVSFTDTETIRVSKRLGVPVPEFSWLQSSLHADAWQSAASAKSNKDAVRDKELQSADFLYEKTLERFEEKFDQARYTIFKRLVDERRRPVMRTRREELQYTEQKLRRFDNGLQNAADSRQRHVNRAFETRPKAGFLIEFFNDRVSPMMRALFPALEPLSFKPDPKATEATMQFLLTNLSPTGLPLGYAAPPGYWDQYKPMMDTVDSIMERLLIQHGISIYDAGLWQAALVSQKDPRFYTMANNYTNRLLSGRSGELEDIRAYGPLFRYGAERKTLTKDEAFFFRIISDRYIQDDPRDHKNYADEFPNMPTLHHEDWKPITGEQAWGAIIGPLQSAYLQSNGRIPLSGAEARLAVSILPAIEAMQSDIGALYHAPDGTYQKNPDDISNENNFSMYAALKMLDSILKDRSPYLSVRVRAIMKKQETYFKKYAFDPKEGVFYQGGMYVRGEFIPAKIFTADCQTWGILAMGPAWIDRYFGEGTSYRLWKNTKERTGYFNSDGLLEGVGFIDGHKILSVEWTCGAILALSEIAEEYKTSHPEWAREAQLDLVSMRHGIEKYKSTTENGSTAYWYANKRFFIPFGWWANPIPSVASSAWVVMIDTGFNPFILGGGSEYKPGSAKVPSYYTVTIPEMAPKRAAAPKDFAKRLKGILSEWWPRNSQAVGRPLPVSHKPRVRSALEAMQPQPKPEADIIFAPRRLFQHAIEEEPFTPKRAGIITFSIDVKWLLVFLAILFAAVLPLAFKKRG